MNLYFWFFSLYVFLILPVSVEIRLQSGAESKRQVRISVAGIPFRRDKIRAKSNARGKGIQNLPLFLSLLKQGHIHRVLRAFRMERICLYIRLSFQDAALTAVTYSAARTAAQMLWAYQRPVPVRGRMEMDFQGRGSLIAADCMFCARMGNLLSAILRLTFAASRERARRFRAEEEKYAASH